MNAHRWQELKNLPLDGDEPVFDEPWQAQVFALTVALHDKGVIDWGKWAQTLGAEIAASPEEPYWNCWFAALQKFMAQTNIASIETIERRTQDWHEAAARTPHGEPINL